MFLDRWTMPIKPGGMEEVTRLWKAEIERAPLPLRLYTAFYGPIDVLLGDTAAESQEATEKMWADWLARPEAPKFFEQWNRLIAGGGRAELWVERLGTPDVRTKYIERRTMTVRHGHMDEALQLAKAEVERIHNTNAHLFTAVYGTLEICLFDVRENDAQAIDKFWTDWGSTPEAAVFHKKWDQHVVTDKRELWVEQ
jgi:hypothetical protein